MHVGRPWLIGFSILLLAACSKRPAGVSSVAFSPEPSFWVWHRTSALTAEELAAVDHGHVSRLYWQIVEFRRGGGEWNPYPLAKREAMPNLPSVIPVIRLAPDLKPFDRPEAPAQFARWLRQWSGERPLAGVQIDYDCPASQLERYAVFLRAFKAETGLKFISVTALASWMDAPSFQRFAGSVDELVPMFYDLTADVPEQAVKGNFQPMVPSNAAARIHAWKACPVPWRAGLPNFERLTLFDAGGKSLGHLRGWKPEELLANKAIEPTGGASAGLVKFRIIHNGGLAGSALLAGQSLVWRGPDEAALRAAIAAARDAGSAGITWFALPGPGLPAAHSSAHLEALENDRTPTRKLSLRTLESGRVVLHNDGPADLPFRPGQAPYRLELKSDAAGSSGDGDPGGFLERQSGVVPKYSRKIWLIFPSLRVDEDIASGDDLWHRQTGNSVQWSVQDDAPVPTP